MYRIKRDILPENRYDGMLIKLVFKEGRRVWQAFEEDTLIAEGRTSGEAEAGFLYHRYGNHPNYRHCFQEIKTEKTDS